MAELRQKRDCEFVIQHYVMNHSLVTFGVQSNYILKEMSTSVTVFTISKTLCSNVYMRHACLFNQTTVSLKDKTCYPQSLPYIHRQAQCFFKSFRSSKEGGGSICQTNIPVVKCNFLCHNLKLLSIIFSQLSTNFMQK